jgi:ABC-type transport system involved in multi-copper enzyme maturation permease subunit
MWRLIIKDFEQHAKNLLIFLLSALALPLMFSLIVDESDGSGYHGVVFGYIVLGAPAIFAFWFIGQEKMKGTMKLLSILPISGREIILTKSLGSALLSISIVNLVMVLVPFIADTVTSSKWFPSLTFITWTNLLTVFFVSLDIAIFTLFDSRIASQVIYLGHALMVFAILFCVKFFPAAKDPQSIIDRLHSIGFKYWGGLLIILASYLLVALSGRIFEMKEWADLEEG